MLLTSIKNVEINHVLSKTWKFILTAVPGGFFLFSFFMARYCGPFSFLRPAQRMSNLNTPHKRYLWVPLTGCCFLRAAGGPFLFTGEKSMSEPLSGSGTAAALGGATVFG
ncbi:TPA: hypothetical protein ACRZFK_003218, partial [Escherichia coli]